MIDAIRKAGLALALTATSLAVVTPASARDRYYRHHRGGDDVAIAIGAGILGLAVGAAIASSNDRRYNDRYYHYDNGYYYPRYRSYYYRRHHDRYYYHGYPVYREYGGYDNYYRYRHDDDDD